MHRSRVCHFVIDVPDLDEGAAFWSAALGAADEPMYEASAPIYRELRLPDSERVIHMIINSNSIKF